MEQVDKSLQSLVRFRVLDEMRNTENNLINWNISWTEQPESYYIFPNCVDLIYDNKYWDKKINTNPSMSERDGEGYLQKIIIDGEECGLIYQITWLDINTKKSTRKISFSSNGNIILEKDGKSHDNKPRIKYQGSFNVLSDDFNLEIEIITPVHITKYRTDYKKEKYSLQLVDNLLIKRHNNIEIVEDLVTGAKRVRIVNEYDKQEKNGNNASVEFEATLDDMDKLQKGAISIVTHKGNGKVNGNFRFDISPEKGVRANFYSRKGKKINLANNPLLLSTASSLMLSCSDNSAILTEFTNETERNIVDNMSNREVCFDTSSFSMDSVVLADLEIMQVVKMIKGEIPVDGLSKRINDCIEKVNSKGEQAKVLELKNNYIDVETI